jgi:hypothetical protein
MIKRFIEWLVRLFRDHDCKRHGHKYIARYDEVIDPRLSASQIESQILARYDPNQQRRSVMAKIYVRDICRFCGDSFERLEGLTEMEVIAHQARRIGP